MKKNLKVISSLAVAGIMATTSLCGVVSAADTTVTKSLGVYRKIVENHNTVPYHVKDKNDRVTIKDIKAEYGTLNKFNDSEEIKPDDTVVKTGDTFEVAGKKYDVIIYGDVNQDGTVNSKDILTLLDHLGAKANEADKKITNDFVIKAADVKRDGSLNSKDVLQLLEYSAKPTENNVIDSEPATEPKEDEEVKSDNYTLVSQVSYINNQNSSSVTVRVQMKSALSENLTGLSLTAEDVAIEGGTDAHSPVASSTTQVDAGRTFQDFTIDCSTLNNGDITIKLKKGNEVLATPIVIEKYEDAVGNSQIKALVTTTRDTENTATLKVESLGKYKIAKVYVGGSTLATAADGTVSNVTATGTANGNVTTVAISGLESFTESTPYYILEDIYGNRTTAANTNARIAKLDAQPIAKVTNITHSNGTFSWTAENTTDTKIVKLYNGTELVDVVEQTANSKDFSAKMTEKAGKYKISVQVRGKAPAGDVAGTKDSEVVTMEDSAAVEVKALVAVQPTIEKRDVSGTEKVFLKWPTLEEKAKGLTVEVETLNNKGEWKKNNAKTTSLQNAIDALTLTTDKEVEVTSIINGSGDKNVVYRVTMVATPASADKTTAVSTKAISNEFLELDTGTIAVVSTTDTTVTLSVTPEVSIGANRANYSVKYNIPTNDGGTMILGSIQEQNVEVVDGKITITGLQPGKTYWVKVVAKANGITGESTWIGKTSGDAIVTKEPDINLDRTLTVITDATKKAENTILFGSGNVTIGTGNAIALNSTAYSAEFRKTLTAISNLNLVAGDEVSVKGDTIKVTPKAAESTAAIVVNEKDRTFEIVGNVNTRKVTVTAGTAILSGNGAKFNVTAVSTEAENKAVAKVTSGVFVKGNAIYTVVAGAKGASINGVTVEPTTDTIVSASGKALTVTANGNNPITFKNGVAGGDVATGDATISFTKNANALEQLGDIIIETTGGSVTLGESNAIVRSAINVTVNSGTVSIPALDNYYGTKTVVINNAVNETAQVVATAKEVVKDAQGNSVAVGFAAIELKKNYTYDDIKAAITAGKITSTGNAITALNITDAQCAAIKKYLENFDLNVGTLTATANDQAAVTFNFPASTTSAITGTIKGIK